MMSLVVNYVAGKIQTLKYSAKTDLQHRTTDNSRILK
jgi:hypothetical protein